MINCGRGIGRFAPLLLVSLLLHLALFMVASGLGRRDSGYKQSPLSIVVDYLESAPEREKLPAKVMQRQIAALALPQTAAHSVQTTQVLSSGPAPATATPVRQSAPLPATQTAIQAKPVENNGLSITGHTTMPSAGAESGAVIGRQETGGSGLTRQGSTAASPSSPDSWRRRNSYQVLIKNLIEAHKEYPLAARKSGREGSCQRRFVIDRNGLLKRVEMLSSCGNTFLDEAASRAITSVGVFPPLPDVFKGAEEAFAITMTFNLARQ